MTVSSEVLSLADGVYSNKKFTYQRVYEWYQSIWLLFVSFYLFTGCKFQCIGKVGWVWDNLGEQWMWSNHVQNSQRSNKKVKTIIKREINNISENHIYLAKMYWK